MKKPKSMPAAWKPVIARATRQLKANRFMAVLETLDPLGDDGMAHKAVSDLHCAALVGFGKEMTESLKAARKKRTPEQRVQERKEARKRAALERERRETLLPKPAVPSSGIACRVCGGHAFYHTATGGGAGMVYLIYKCTKCGQFTPGKK